MIDWIFENLAAPDKAQFEPFELYREQEDFVLRFYELDPLARNPFDRSVAGKRKISRGLIGRPRGWGKSPFLAALACVEALGPVVPAGWDADGQPVGRPWADVRTPLVQIAAVSEEQTANTWAPLLEMLDGPVIDNYPGLEPLGTFVNLPRGRIEPKTAAARSIKGARAVFGVMDQTEEWIPSNGGVLLANTMRTNAAKVGGSTIESPNAFVPGERSVAEQSAAYASSIRSGHALNDGLLYDHRESPPETDMFERESITAGLRVSYGDSSNHPDGCVIHDPPCEPGHADLEALIVRIWDSDSDVQLSRADFLNQITHATDSWLSQPEWAACYNSEKVIADRDPIVLGFDGSRARKRGITDSTALVGCRVSDGHLFLLNVWEHPKTEKEWRVPVVEVDAAVRTVFATRNVVGMYADPPLWESYIAQWEADFNKKLQVKATRDHPIEWAMQGGNAKRTVEALASLHSAIVEGEMTHDGSEVLTRHFLNARNRAARAGMQIAKENPDSPNKIDAAVAATAAWQCRLDAIAAGIGKAPTQLGVPIRLR